MSLRIAGEVVYVPDFTALVQGAMSKLVEEKRIVGRIIVHRAVLQVLEHSASKDRVEGYTGLEEVRRLREYSEKGLIKVEIAGERIKSLPPDEIEAVNEVNAAVREYAYSVNGVLVTGSELQYQVAKAMGVQVLFVGNNKTGKLKFETYFTEDTMSVHLKEGVEPVAKVGRPGEWKFVKLGDKPLTRREIEEMANEIIEATRSRRDAFIEIDRAGSTIIQLGAYRIVVTRPPLSDGWEITAVRPLKRLKLEEYNLPPELLKRLEERAEGILIAGAPGMGKTTFAQALAEYYMRMNKVVKTIESPRDMILPPNITQYSKHYAVIGELHDILLLSRPDYTVFDEMRTDEDFKLFADLRLAGIGMIGVIHATTPIDAIQRFIGRVELGMIPSIVDTVIFVRNGQVDKVYEVRMTVKLPTGLREAELSRPVIEVRDFLTGELEYEIYTFGEQTVVVPVKKLRGKLSIHEKLVEEITKIIPGADVLVEDNTIVVVVSRGSLKDYNKRVRKLRRLEEKYKIPLRIRVKE
ncbi:MAG: PINc/VapC family ATPase [Desulfurococcus sp.]|nr:PINc/VapC family ATPase [Desulfurococcus sp.]